MIKLITRILHLAGIIVHGCCTVDDAIVLVIIRVFGLLSIKVDATTEAAIEK